MKIFKYISILFYGILLLQGCEEMKIGDAALEKPPTVTVTRDTVFSKLEYAERFLFGGYKTLPYGLNTNWSDKGNKLGMDILESLTDICHSYMNWGGTNQLYYSGQYNAGSEDVGNNTKYHYFKEQSWNGIRIGWIFIENANKIPDATQEYIDQMKAEARVLIALHYSDMFRHFGGLPWINKSFNPADNMDLPRLTAKATLDSIIHQLDLAIPYLPWTISDVNNDGRFTKASAMGLKARMLLFGASPLFNDDVPYLDGEAAQKFCVWYGGKDPSLWQKAADAAVELINAVESNGYYALVNTGNAREDFQNAYYLRGNGEVLISTRVRFKSPGGYWDENYYFYQSAGDYGTACPSQEYVDLFSMADGTPISDPNSGYDPDNPFVNRDPRLYETVLVNGDTYQGRTAELWIGGRERKNANFNGTKSGYGIRKFILERNKATSLGSIVHWPYLRLAEIYLSAAEALNEVNGGPTSDAYRYVDIVRARAGLNGLSQGLSQQEFRDAVLQERAKEFGYEEVRWFDLIRWKRSDVFEGKLHGTDLYKNEDGTYRRELKELPARYWRDSWSPKWYLSAFPPSEVYKGYGLIQNPGWE